MSYTLYNSDGTILTIIADGTIDRFTTNLTLVGKNVPSYGQYINENFVTLLSNSASIPQNIPLNPLPGQLWYDTINSQLKIFDNDLDWRNVIGAEIDPNLPTSLGIGDFWFDQINKQLHIKPNSSTATWIIGPAFSSIIGGNGWVLPTVPVTDINGLTQNITLLENYGTVIGLINSNPFIMSSADSLTYFGTSTQQSIVAGLTIFEDIFYGGNIINKGLSLTVNLPSMFPQHFNSPDTPVYPYDYNQLITDQNPAIQRLLTMSFPPVNAQQVPFIDIRDQKGFPVGSEASIIVYTQFTNTYGFDPWVDTAEYNVGTIVQDNNRLFIAINSVGPTSFSDTPPVPASDPAHWLRLYDDHHVRRFRIVYDHGIGQNRWDAVMVYPVPQTRDENDNVTGYYQSLSNVVPEYNPNESTQNWINVPE